MDKASIQKIALQASKEHFCGLFRMKFRNTHAEVNAGSGPTDLESELS